MKPPMKDEVESSELWLKLNEPRPSEVIDFPRKDRKGNPIGKIRIQVLRMEDHNRARILATKALREAVKDFGLSELTKDEMESDAVREVLGDLIAHELLCLACLTDKEQVEGGDEFGNPIYGRVFATPKHIRQTLTADETLVLFNAYRMVQYKYGPFEKTINDDSDVEAWITRLKEGGSEFPLLALPLPQLAELAYCLSEKISLLSQILASQQSSLPDTLVSSLKSCFSGIFSYGEQLNNLTQKLEEISQGMLEGVDMRQIAAMSLKEKDSFTVER